MNRIAPIEFISTVAETTFPDDWYDISRPDHFWFQWRFRAAFRQAVDAGLSMAAPLKVLEIGCGPGVLRKQFESATEWTIDATDLYVPALKAAKAGRGRTLYYDVLEERPEFVDSYEAVILSDVLEHIENTRAFLKSVLRHLKPGGYLLVNVPALNMLYSAYDVAAGHLRRYDHRSLPAEFAQMDLEVVDVRYWGLSLIPLLVARKLWLGRRRASGQTIREGFEPPGALSHAVLRTMMRIETGLMSRPISGSSVLLAGRRGRKTSAS